MTKGQKEIQVCLTLSMAITSHHHCVSHWFPLTMWEGRAKSKGCHWLNIVGSLQSVAKVIVSCVGVRAEQSKERKLNQTHTYATTQAKSRSFFLESHISGCRFNFLFSFSLHLYSSFCWTKPNDVPCDKCWLTTSHQQFQAHRQRRVRAGIYTHLTCSNILASSR